MSKPLSSSPYPCALCGQPLKPTGKAGRRPNSCPGCKEIRKSITRLSSALRLHGGRLPTEARNRLRAELRSLLNATLNSYHPRKSAKGEQHGEDDRQRRAVGLP